MSRERRRDAAAERRIKVSGNVIYEIDLNPAFKPRAIIQSRSPFPSFSASTATLFSILFLVFSLLDQPCMHYPSRARSILDIYLGTYSSYSLRDIRPRIYTITYTSLIPKVSFTLSSSITDDFFDFSIGLSCSSNNLYFVIIPVKVLDALVYSIAIYFETTIGA